MPRAGSRTYRKRDKELEPSRYRELYYKARQYQTWKDMLDILRNTSKAITYSDMPKAPQVEGDPISNTAIKCAELSEKIEKVEESVRIATMQNPEMYSIMLSSITLGLSYETLEMQLGVLPCGRNKFHNLKREVFWLMHNRFD